MNIPMKNVLVVDDDKIAHFLSERIIQTFDHINNIYRAFNGREALAILDNYCKGRIDIPDLILLDLHMPIMNGLEFIKAFRAMDCVQGKGVVIAVLSSSENPEEQLEIQRLGVEHFIEKPITLEKIRGII